MVDTVFVLETASSASWDTFLAVIAGGVIGLIPFLVELVTTRRNQFRIWFFEQYVTNGVDVIISNLNHLRLGYNLILMHKEHPAINARIKAQRYIKGANLKMLADAANKIETVTPCHNIGTLLIALNDDMCVKIKDEDLAKRNESMPSIVGYFVALRKVLIQAKVASSVDIYELAQEKSIELETRTSGIVAKIDQLVQSIGENYVPEDAKQEDGNDGH